MGQNAVHGNLRGHILLIAQQVLRTNARKKPLTMDHPARNCLACNSHT